MDAEGTAARSSRRSCQGLCQVGSRILEYLIALTILVILSFLAVHALPGDPLDVLYGDASVAGLSTEARSRLLSLYGLDGSLLDQFLRYLHHLLRGDLGLSTRYGMPVLDMILAVLPWTVLLVLTATGLSFVMGTMAGVEAGLRHGRRSGRWLLAVLALLDSIPPFVKALLLLFVFVIGLDVLPAAGGMTPFSSARGLDGLVDIAFHALAPLTVLVLHEVTKILYFARASTITILSRPFLTVARAKGISGVRLRGTYVAPNAMAAVVAQTAAMMTHMISGAVFVETVFSYPGIGLLIFDGIFGRDYPLVQGALLAVGTIILTINLVADILILRLTARG